MLSFTVEPETDKVMIRYKLNICESEYRSRCHVLR